jgi:hypothetical protein
MCDCSNVLIQQRFFHGNCDIVCYDTGPKVGSGILKVMNRLLLVICAFGSNLVLAATPSKDPHEISQAAREAEAAAPAEYSTNTQGLVEETLPDGTKKIDLQGRFQMEVTMKKGDDGKMHATCDAAGEKHEHTPVVAAAESTTTTEDTSR